MWWRGAERPAGPSGWLLLISLLMISGATLLPSSDFTVMPGVCLVCGSRGLADAVLNTLLFLPLGIALGWRTRPSLLPLAVPLLLSSGIEIAQVFIPGRDGSLGDILFNGLGGAIGVLSGWSSNRVALMSDRTAGRAGLACGAIVPLVFLLTAWLLEPVLPDSQYFSQWAPNLPEHIPYGGKVEDAAIGDISLPAGRLADSDTVRHLLVAGAPLRITGVAGPPPASPGAMYAIYDDSQREIIFVGHGGADLLVRLYRRSNVFKLDAPDIRWTNGFSSIKAGDPVNVAVWREGEAACLSVGLNDGQEDRSVSPEQRCGLGETIGRGWSLLAYPEALAHSTWLLDMAWMWFLFVPIGIWTRQTPAGRAGIILAVMGLVGVPAATQLLATPPYLYVAGGGGWLAGLALQKLMNRRR
jgi:hypothetical protein